MSWVSILTKSIEVGGLLTVPIVFLVVLYLVYQFGKLVQRFSSQDDEEIADIRGISEKVVKLETKIDLIYQHTLPAHLQIAKAQSPISLTDTGEINEPKKTEL